MQDMKVLLELGRPMRALTVAVALGLCLFAYGQDVGDPNNGYGPNNRPVYAFVSLDDTFNLPVLGEVDQDLRDAAASMGSQMIRLKIGTFLAGPSIRTTRFRSDGLVTFDPNDVPPDTNGNPPDFEGNHLTIVGSFKTLAPDLNIHLMTPYPQPISASVQQAYFNASVFFDNGALSRFPTTVEVALFIFDNQGSAGASIDDILVEIFHVEPVTPVVLKPTTGGTVVTGEGDLFPHTPGDGEYGFDVDLDPEEGHLDADVCLNVLIDVKPDSNNNTVNVKNDNGVLPIAVLTTDDFDAVNELDPDTVFAVLIGTDGEVVNEVAAERYAIEDVDGDGDDDVTFKFSVTALVDGPNAPLTTTTTTIFFRGETLEGMCVQGSDSVKIVPKSK